MLYVILYRLYVVLYCIVLWYIMLYDLDYVISYYISDGMLPACSRGAREVKKRRRHWLRPIPLLTFSLLTLLGNSTP